MSLPSAERLVSIARQLMYGGVLARPDAELAGAALGHLAASQRRGDLVALARMARHQRDGLIRELGSLLPAPPHPHHPGEPHKSAHASAVLAEIARYRRCRWRWDAASVTCPPDIANTIDGLIWRILKSGKCPTSRRKVEDLLYRWY